MAINLNLLNNQPQVAAEVADDFTLSPLARLRYVASGTKDVALGAYKFSRGLIGRSLGRLALSIGVPLGTSYAGGAAAGAVLAQAGPLVAYAPPAAVAVGAAALAKRSSSIKVRIGAGVLCLAAIGTTIYLFFSSSEGREQAAGQLTAVGVFAGVKTAQVVGSFVGQRLVGVQTTRKENVPNKNGQAILDLAGNPVQNVISEPVTLGHVAQGFGQSFVAEAFLPFAFPRQVPVRDAIFSALAYSAVPVAEGVRGFIKGRERGFKGNIVTMIAGWIGDPKKFASELAKQLQFISTLPTEDARLGFLKGYFAEKHLVVPEKFLKILIKFLNSKIISKIAQLTENALEALILVILGDLDRIVGVTLNASNRVAQLLVENQGKIQAAGNDPEALDRAMEEILIKEFPSLRLTNTKLFGLLKEGPLGKGVTPVANGLAKAILDFEDNLVGGAFNLYPEHTRAILPIYIKYFLMSICTSYEGTANGFSDQNTPITRDVQRDLFTRFGDLFAPLLLPEAVAGPAAAVVKVAARANHFVGKDPVVQPAPLKGRASRMASAFGSRLVWFLKALFGAIGEMFKSLGRKISRAAHSASESIKAPFVIAPLPY